MSEETKEARELRELLAELRYSYGDASQEEQKIAADLIESQAERIEKLEKANTELQSRFTHLNSMLSELQRRKEPELARNCPVCGKPQHGVVLHGPGTTVYWHVDGTGDNCEGLPAQNAELKQENATLRATTELVERAEVALRNGWELCEPAEDDPQFTVFFPCGKPRTCDTLREALEILGITESTPAPNTPGQ